MLADGPGGDTGARVDLRLDRPHSARMYDYYLGGKDHYEADRKAAAELAPIFPHAQFAARTNRGFMHRVIGYLAEQGIRQFLDIGAGIPTEPNLHQIAQRVAPQSRVVYVDNDPLVLAHARALLVSSPQGRTAYLPADVTTPQAILTSPLLHDTLNLGEPVALSLFALLHFVPDEHRPHAAVQALMKALAPGSYLVLSHATADFAPDLADAGIAVYHSSGISMQARTRAEFARFFAGLDLIEPGVTTPHGWRPLGPQPPKSFDRRVSCYAAVGRK